MRCVQLSSVIPLISPNVSGISCLLAIPVTWHALRLGALLPSLATVFAGLRLSLGPVARAARGEQIDLTPLLLVRALSLQPPRSHSMRAQFDRLFLRVL